MSRVEKSALVPYAGAKMFALVDDVALYPEFLPWCGEGVVTERTAEITIAKITIDFHGIKQSFTTRNTKRGLLEMDIQLVDGPFKRLDGAWRFQPLAENACKIALELEYGFANALLENTVGPVFDMIANTMIERFVARADTLYQGQGA